MILFQQFRRRISQTPHFDIQLCVLNTSIITSRELSSLTTGYNRISQNTTNTDLTFEHDNLFTFE